MRSAVPPPENRIPTIATLEELKASVRLDTEKAGIYESVPMSGFSMLVLGQITETTKVQFHDEAEPTTMPKGDYLALTEELDGASITGKTVTVVQHHILDDGELWRKVEA